jgi:hypothetical protein
LQQEQSLIAIEKRLPLRDPSRQEYGLKSDVRVLIESRLLWPKKSGFENSTVA